MGVSLVGAIAGGGEERSGQAHGRLHALWPAELRSVGLLIVVSHFLRTVHPAIIL